MLIHDEYTCVGVFYRKMEGYFRELALRGFDGQVMYFYTQQANHFDSLAATYECSECTKDKIGERK